MAGTLGENELSVRRWDALTYGIWRHIAGKGRQAKNQATEISVWT